MSNIRVKGIDLYRVRALGGIVWQRTPDTFTGTVMYEKETSSAPDDNRPISCTLYLYDKDMNVLDTVNNISDGSLSLL